MGKILKSFSGYPNRFLESLELNYTIFLTESGGSAFYGILGFIAGAWLIGRHETANRYADEFEKAIDMLGRSKLVDFAIPAHSGQRLVKVPNVITTVGADGTMMGLTFCRFRLLEDQSVIPDRNKVREFGLWDAKYGFDYNGAMIHRGDGQEKYSVELSGSDHLWSFHT